MEIKIHDLDFIEKSVKVTKVFSPNTMEKVARAIQDDLVEEIFRGYERSTDRPYAKDTVLGSLKIVREGLDYSIFALECSLYDFLQEFDGYVDEYWHEYEQFMEDLRDGKFDITVG